MDKLESMDIQVYRTDEQGTIVAVSDGTTITWDQEPCNDYTPGEKEDQGTQTQKAETENSSSSGTNAGKSGKSSSKSKAAAASAGSSSQITATPQVTETPQDTSSTSNEEMYGSRLRVPSIIIKITADGLTRARQVRSAGRRRKAGDMSLVRSVLGNT